MERRLLINSIGPVWDANEVWLLTAGGATFAAFPNWYATMFSGFYLALFLILLALIVRGVSFDFRSKIEDAKWKKVWDGAISVGSLLPPLLLGVAFADLIKGVPIDSNFEFAGNFFDLLSIPSLLAGVTVVAVCIYHGAVYITLKLEPKTDGGLAENAYKIARNAGILSIALVVVMAILAAFFTDAYKNVLSLVFAAAAVLSLAASYVFILRKKSGISMILNSVVMFTSVAAIFSGLFPRVMVSSISPANSLTIYNASSSPYTLTVMSIITVTVLPIVLGYLIWTYWVFRKRVSGKKLEY